MLPDDGSPAPALGGTENAAPAPEDAQRIAEQAAARMRAGDAATEGAGVEIVSVGPGHAVARMTVDGRHLNGYDMCHGGYLFLLADTALAYASNSSGQPAVAAGAEISFLRPAVRGDVVTAVAEQRAAAGRSGIYDVTVRRADDVVLAEFRGRTMRLRNPPRP
jgi:acyl-CoA thioesterase